MATAAWEMFAFNVNTDSQVLEFFNNNSSKVWKYVQTHDKRKWKLGASTYTVIFLISFFYISQKCILHDKYVCSTPFQMQ